MTDEVFDLVVIGGGVTGAGAALDAATRGLKVAVVEAQDWAAGTSSRSSRLVHGGLRYLQRGDFGLVLEALAERRLLLDVLAPHLVRPVAFTYPLRRRYVERPYVGLGLLLYDLMGGARRGLPMHRHLSRRAALDASPGLDPDGLAGAVRYHDAQVDDARFTMMLARTAVHHGAVAATRLRVTGLELEAGRIGGVRACDVLSGREITVRARRVINAAGPWTEPVQGLAGPPAVRLRPSKGVHLVVPRDRIALDGGLIVPTESSVLLVIPWGGHWIVGTTDTDWRHGGGDPHAHGGDVDYLLERLNAVLARPLTRADVTATYAGVRPLLAPAAAGGPTAAISREHAVVESPPGLVTVAGGKFTTYRVMARDAVDAAARGLGRPVPRSCTRDVPLLGATGFRARVNERERLAAEAGTTVAWVDHLLGRYGDLVGDVLALVARRPDLGRPLEAAAGYLRAEVVYAAACEGALSVGDVLARRTHAAIETADRGTAAAWEVAALLGGVLGWTDERRHDETERYRAAVEAELGAERAGSDEAALRARAGAV